MNLVIIHTHVLLILIFFRQMIVVKIYCYALYICFKVKNIYIFMIYQSVQLY